jgi:hypothetical protein
MRALFNFGTAMVTIIRMIAITISNSISENPDLLLVSLKAHTPLLNFMTHVAA